jgi:hypothetical protein
VSFEIQPLRPERNQSVEIIGICDEIEFVDSGALASRATPPAPISGATFADLRGSGLMLFWNHRFGLLVGRGASRVSGFSPVLRPSGVAATSSPTPPAVAATRGSLCSGIRDFVSLVVEVEEGDLLERRRDGLLALPLGRLPLLAPSRSCAAFATTTAAPASGTPAAGTGGAIHLLCGLGAFGGRESIDHIGRSACGGRFLEDRCAARDFAFPEREIRTLPLDREAGRLECQVAEHAFRRPIDLLGGHQQPRRGQLHRRLHSFQQRGQCLLERERAVEDVRRRLDAEPLARRPDDEPPIFRHPREIDRVQVGTTQRPAPDMPKPTRFGEGGDQAAPEPFLSITNSF